MLKSLTRKDVLEVAKLADACKAKNQPGFLHYPSAEADKMTKEILKGGSPERKRLVAKIESLTPEALEELEALMLFGRGDHAATFAECLEHAARNRSEGTVGYIAGKSLALGSYLRDGLKKLEGHPKAA
jgi:hypothetical protein